jgi:hypothetical protein
VNEWEYKTCFMDYQWFEEGEQFNLREGVRLQPMTDAQLAQFGSEGWELVNVVRLVQQSRRKGFNEWSNELTWKLQYIFKRPKR